MVHFAVFYLKSYSSFRSIPESFFTYFVIWILPTFPATVSLFSLVLGKLLCCVKEYWHISPIHTDVCPFVTNSKTPLHGSGELWFVGVHCYNKQNARTYNLLKHNTSSSHESNTFFTPSCWGTRARGHLPSPYIVTLDHLPSAMDFLSLEARGNHGNVRS